MSSNKGRYISLETALKLNELVNRFPQYDTDSLFGTDDCAEYTDDSVSVQMPAVDKVRSWVCSNFDVRIFIDKDMYRGEFRWSAKLNVGGRSSYMQTGLWFGTRNAATDDALFRVISTIIRRT